MLYNKACEEITWEDIESFCESQYAEHICLDYKENFLNDLVKTIAAMANTHGGIILIGVAETKDSKPELPIKGIEYQPKLEDKVINMIVDRMFPPAIPEIKVCTNYDKSRALIFIRIHESNEGPHALADRTEVYIRTGNRSKFFENLADLDKIAWLSDRRSKSEELKKKIYLSSQERFNALTHPLQKPLTLSICPLYPHSVFKNPPDLREVFDQIRLPSLNDPEEKFPMNSCRRRLTQDSCIAISQEGIKSSEGHYYELSCFGAFIFRVDLSNNNIPGYFIYSKIREFIASSQKLYGILGFWDVLEFRFLLENIQNSELELSFEYPPKPKLSNSLKHNSLDPFVTSNYSLKFSDLEDQEYSNKLSLKVIQKIGWTFDLELTVDESGKLRELNSRKH